MSIIKIGQNDLQTQMYEGFRIERDKYKTLRDKTKNPLHKAMCEQKYREAEANIKNLMKDIQNGHINHHITAGITNGTIQSKEQLDEFKRQGR